jgi:hypothetical protein
MRDDMFDAIIVISMFCICAFIGGCGGHKIATSKFEKAAIEHKAAQYNPTTGKFEWLDKSGEVQ